MSVHTGLCAQGAYFLVDEAENNQVNKQGKKRFLSGRLKTTE